jgi:hypothetical protein
MNVIDTPRKRAQPIILINPYQQGPLHTCNPLMKPETFSHVHALQVADFMTVGFVRQPPTQIPRRGLPSSTAQPISHNSPSARAVFDEINAITPWLPLILVLVRDFQDELYGSFTDISTNSTGVRELTFCPENRFLEGSSSLANAINIRLRTMQHLESRSTARLPGFASAWRSVCTGDGPIDPGGWRNRSPAVVGTYPRLDQDLYLRPHHQDGNRKRYVLS